MKQLKQLSKFKNEDEEAEFWNTHYSTKYFGWSQTKNVAFPNLKLPQKAADKKQASK